MYVIIIGAGTYGNPLAHKAVEKGHDVVVVEENEAVAKELSTQIDAMVINGDATNENILEEAGIEESDFLVSTVSLDSVNVLVALLAQEYDTERVAAIASSEKYQSIFEQIGVDFVERPQDVVSDEFLNYISYPKVSDFLKLGDEKSVVTIEVSHDSPVVGEKVQDIVGDRLPTEALIVAVRSNGDVEIPTGDSTVEAGTKVVIACSNDELGAIQNLLQP